MCGGGLVTKLRDTVESGLALSANMIVPGVSSMGLTSEGSQDQLSSGVGKALTIGTDIAGAAGLAAGGGALLSGLAGGSAAGTGAMSLESGLGALDAGAMTGGQLAGLGSAGSLGEAGAVTSAGLEGVGFGGAASGAGGLLSGLANGGLSGALSLGQGALGLYNASQASSQAKAAAAAADPFAPYRGQYAQQLSQLMADPSLLTKTPGYEAGIQAVERSMASQGYGGSGNMAAALQQYGGNAYQQQVSTLAQLAGAQFNPANAQQIGQQGQQYSQGLTGQSLGTLAQGGMSLFNAFK